MSRKHCWHSDTVGLSMGGRSEQGEGCCWCGARRTRVICTVQVSKGHGPYATPKTRQVVTYESVTAIPKTCSGEAP